MGRLTDFIEYLLKERLEEVKRENERRTWELWLHRVWDQSYQDFCDAATSRTKNQERAAQMDDVDIKHAANVALDTLSLLGKGGRKSC